MWLGYVLHSDRLGRCWAFYENPGSKGLQTEIRLLYSLSGGKDLKRYEVIRGLKNQDESHGFRRLRFIIHDFPFIHRYTIGPISPIHNHQAPLPPGGQRLGGWATLVKACNSFAVKRWDENFWCPAGLAETDGRADSLYVPDRLVLAEHGEPGDNTAEQGQNRRT